MVVDTFNPSIQEAQAEGTSEFEACLIYRAQVEVPKIMRKNENDRQSQPRRCRMRHTFPSSDNNCHLFSP